MPKEPKHIAGAQKQRKKIKEKFIKYVPGKVTLQVLGTGAQGAPRSLYVFTDQTRYMFNCGEGTQRLAHEHKMKLSKLENIFITQAVWKNIGGLPGAALTMQDVGVPEVTLHGPRGLDKLFNATRRFVVMKDLVLKSGDSTKLFSDNVMQVQCVPIVKRKELVDDVILESDEEHISLADSFIERCSQSTQSSTDTMECGTSTRSERKRSRNRSKCKTGSTGSSRSSSAASDDEDNTDYYAHELSGFRNVPQTISSEVRQELTKIKTEGVSMAYICRLTPRPGTLSLEKCVDFGVPPGPLLGRLKGGEDIVLPNGKTVRSKEVCEAEDPGPVFIVVDCPSEEYLDSLLSSEAFVKHQSTAKNDDDVAAVVVHFSPLNIIKHPRYKLWIDKFSPSTHHMLINEANSCMGSISVHRVQYMLNYLSSDIFPLLGDRGTEIINVDVDSDTPASKKLKGNDSLSKEAVTSQIGELTVDPSIDGSFKKVNTFCNFHLRPRKAFDESEEIKITPNVYLHEIMNIQDFSATAKELELKLRHKKNGMTIRDYPKIVFLGTGSCIPNKTRNTSGILLMTSPTNNILIDCGEGTYGQIIRFFGPDGSLDILSNLNAIYISHLHADHHIGLNGVLLGRRQALDKLGLDKEPLMLLAPRQISHWLNFYDSCFEEIQSEFYMVPNAEMLLGKNVLTDEIKKIMHNTLEMNDISTCFVRHCPNAFGVSFMHKNGYKITYSGDTMPCDDLVTLGRNSDILIHEATMEDELAKEAIIKMHSTTSQAIEIGERMNATHTLLTHFSQRYAKLPRFNDNFADNIGIAFDNMQVKLDELPLLPLLNPALQIMFAEHTEEMENKAFKRQMRIEREEKERSGS